MTSIAELGRQIDGLLPSRTHDRLNSGSTNVPREFSSDLVDLYRWHNGESQYDIFDPIFAFHFLPVSDCLEESRKIRNIYPDCEPLGRSWVIGYGYGDSLVLAIHVSADISQVAYFFIDSGACVGAHDSVLSLMQTTLATWEKLSQPGDQRPTADFEAISKRFSSCVGVELWRAD